MHDELFYSVRGAFSDHLVNHTFFDFPLGSICRVASDGLEA